MDPIRLQFRYVGPLQQQTELGRAYAVVNMFWSSGEVGDIETNICNNVKAERRCWNLTTSIRSGDNCWFSAVVGGCLRGEISEANYRFVHGLNHHRSDTALDAYADAMVNPHDVQTPVMQCGITRHMCTQSSTRPTPTITLWRPFNSAA